MQVQHAPQGPVQGGGASAAAVGQQQQQRGTGARRPHLNGKPRGGEVRQALGVIDVNTGARAEQEGRKPAAANAHANANGHANANAKVHAVAADAEVQRLREQYVAMKEDLKKLPARRKLWETGRHFRRVLDVTDPNDVVPTLRRKLDLWHPTARSHFAARLQRCGLMPEAALPWPEKDSAAVLQLFTEMKVELRERMAGQPQPQPQPQQQDDRTHHVRHQQHHQNARVQVAAAPDARAHPAPRQEQAQAHAQAQQAAARRGSGSGSGGGGSAAAAAPGGPTVRRPEHDLQQPQPQPCPHDRERERDRDRRAGEQQQQQQQQQAVREHPQPQQRRAPSSSAAAAATRGRRRERQDAPPPPPPPQQQQQRRPQQPPREDTTGLAWEEVLARQNQRWQQQPPALAERMFPFPGVPASPACCGASVAASARRSRSAPNAVSGVFVGMPVTALPASGSVAIREISWPIPVIWNVAYQNNVDALKVLLKEDPSLLDAMGYLKTKPTAEVGEAQRLGIRLVMPDGANHRAGMHAVLPAPIGDESRGTPLHYAVMGGAVDTVKYLLKKGASLDTASQQGSKAMFMATNPDKPEVVAALRKELQRRRDPSRGRGLFDRIADLFN